MDFHLIYAFSLHQTLDAHYVIRRLAQAKLAIQLRSEPSGQDQCPGFDHFSFSNYRYPVGMLFKTGYPATEKVLCAGFPCLISERRYVGHPVHNTRHRQRCFESDRFVGG